MKLVLATPLYPPESGGPATYAQLLHDRLPAQGIEVEVVKFSDVRRLPKFVRHIAYYMRVARALKSADAVLALDPVSVGLPALRAAQSMRKPFFVKVVGDYAWEQGTQRFGITDTLDAFVKRKHVPHAVAILRKIQKKVVDSAKRVIVPSNYLKSILLSWGVREHSIEVIYNSVLLAEGGVVPKEIQHAPRPHIVTVGRLVPWKGMRGVIDAVADISGATLAIVGDGPERAQLEQYAKGKLPNTIFTGALAHADTLAVMADADVFVLNSSYEGLSHLLIEAMSLGTPTVATRVGGNTELLEHEEGSTLVSFGDTAELSRAIGALVSKAKKPSTFRVRFAPESMITETAKLLRSNI